MNPLRTAKFTSSEIWKLMTDGKKAGDIGKPAQTYIKAKQYEHRLQRRLSSNVFSYATSWGQFMENYVNEHHLPPSLKMTSQDFICHPELTHFGGSPDIIAETTVYDIKNPFTLLSFCDMIECLKQGVEAFKSEMPEYYWQLVSNAILTDKKRIGLIVFVPYESELVEVWGMAENFEPESDPFQFKWIYDSKKEKLPYLIDGGHYQNLNIFEFDLIESDATDLINRIAKYSPLINL